MMVKHGNIIASGKSSNSSRHDKVSDDCEQLSYLSIPSGDNASPSRASKNASHEKDCSVTFDLPPEANSIPDEYNSEAGSVIGASMSVASTPSLPELSVAAMRLPLGSNS